MTTGNFYELNTLVRMWAAFTDLSGVPADPTAVLIFLRHPDGTQSSPPITRAGVGSYYADMETSAPGTWIYKWQGTGTIEVMSPDTKIVVKPTSIELP